MTRVQPVHRLGVRRWPKPNVVWTDADYLRVLWAAYVARVRAEPWWCVVSVQQLQPCLAWIQGVLHLSHCECAVADQEARGVRRKTASAVRRGSGVRSGPAAGTVT